MKHYYIGNSRADMRGEMYVKIVDDQGFQEYIRDCGYDDEAEWVEDTGLKPSEAYGYWFIQIGGACTEGSRVYPICDRQVYGAHLAEDDEVS